jgi:hypothetical protein
LTSRGLIYVGKLAGGGPKTPEIPLFFGKMSDMTLDSSW